MSPLRRLAFMWRTAGCNSPISVYGRGVCRFGRTGALERDAHLARLERSLIELEQGSPMSRLAMAGHIDRMISLNRIRNGIVYIPGDTRCGAEGPPLPGPDSASDIDHDGPPHRSGQGVGDGRSRYRRDMHAGHPLGALRYQDHGPGSQMFWPSRRRAHRAPMRPGWSTRRDWLPKVRANAWIVDFRRCSGHTLAEP